jgi:uncharacterized NAD(P)/FAD-binding protein YdhS
MRSDRRTAVAIVGGGFSGTILAAQLAQRGIESVLIDGSGRMGRGIAYSTTEPAHLLNVRAEGMSAWSGKPDDFALRFEDEGGERAGFAERRFFARYLGDILDEAVASGKAQPVEAVALNATRNDDGWRIQLDPGAPIEADALALAVGNQEPEPLRAFSNVGERFIGNPWGTEARWAVKKLSASGGSVLLLGTGLTMIDLVLSLDAAGHKGRIVAMSRRGLIPRSHADFDPAPVAADEVPHGSVGDLWRWLRRRSAEVGWRAAVDGLRPHSHPLWQSLSADQQRQFLRHARPWWDVHRHRIAPEVARSIAGLVGEGRLEVIAGRIISAREEQDELIVQLRRRHSSSVQEMRFAYAFNCTGPLHAINRTKDPLLRSLLDAAQVRPDQLGIGLKVDERSRAGEHLWALGPLTKGRYWEIIAVPDIREQAAVVAEDIARELGR